MLLYKYRSLVNWKFLVDIFANRRFYAAPFQDLNDPMEGYYSYATGQRVSEQYDATIRQAKLGWFICSLSEEPRSTLMWSYCGGGHTGVAIGIERPRGYRLAKVTYDNVVTLAGRSTESPSLTAVAILSQKLHSWRHEAEHRVFSPRPYVPVTIREVLLGCKATRDDKRLVKALAAHIRPRVAIRRLGSSELKADYGPPTNRGRNRARA